MPDALRGHQQGVDPVQRLRDARWRQNEGDGVIRRSIRLLVPQYGEQQEQQFADEYGGKLKLIAVIEEPAVIEKILMHIGLDPRPPPIAPARRRADLLEWA